ncbi:lactosylceramide 4-alpha-galactosyltransferase-like [Chelonus insularis]|uniref:lactosylceramide 4-alpha-galactosyltransferase-like n=1 Tax=Chelonus insularis TaxID=460826 RepID=UPI00158DE429|nr:lactosylceramide 4-alpha-galactosyltransferase-like [Chelonus insularis]
MFYIYKYHSSITNCYNNTIDNFRKKKNITCYFDLTASNSIKKLEEKELTEISQINNHIFFVETSCSEDEIFLNPRQACAVESAAKMNPEMEIYLLILSSANFSNKTKNLVNHLQTYNNVNIRKVIIGEYVKNTILEQWWASGIFQSSQWPKEHMSDVLRYLTLLKFPGIYLDLDMVTMSSLKYLEDFAVAQDSNYVNSAILKLSASNIGRRIASLCLEYLTKNFQGDSWFNNGPGVITNILRKLCGTKKTYEMSKQSCRGFTVYPPSTFYPIDYSIWIDFFDSKEKNKTMEKIGKAWGIHLWNKLSTSRPIYVGEDVPYALIASQYCPKIYHNCGDIF